MHYLMRKMTVIESFCVNFKDVMIHAMAYDYIKQFYCEYLGDQYILIKLIGLQTLTPHNTLRFEPPISSLCIFTMAWCTFYLVVCI